MKKVVAVFLCILVLAFSTACGSGKASENVAIDLDALYEKILLETSTESMSILSEKRLDTYIGLSADLYSEAVVALCGDSVLADEIWLVKAADAEALKEITALAEERLDQKAKEMENYLPDQYEIVKQAQVIVRGDYLGVFVSPEADTMAKMFNEAE